MHTLPDPTGRNAGRTATVLDYSAPRDAGSPFAPGEGGGRLDRQGVVGSVVRRRPDVEAECKPPTLARVLETKKAVDTGGQRATLPAGKVVSSAHYDLQHLRNQGVKLGRVDEEVISMWAGAGITASREVSFAEVSRSVEAMGLRLVPADTAPTPASSSDVVALLTEMQAKFDAVKADLQGRLDAQARELEELRKRDARPGRPPPAAKE